MLPIHVINLAREPDRLARIAAALDGFGLAWARVEAIDRLAAPPETLARTFGGGRLARAYPATPGDIACSLTHRQIWDEIAGGAAEAAVVLEDDAALAPEFPAFAEASIAGLMRVHDMGALKLEFWPGPQQSRRHPLGTRLCAGPGGSALYRLRSGFLGSCGYVLTARAAADLLTHFATLAVPVDHFLFGRSAGLGFKHLCPGFVNPAPVLHDVGRFPSDIGPGRGDKARTIFRRLRDGLARHGERRDLRRGAAERVKMRFSGDGA